ncbi:MULTISPECIES: NAD(P)H-dependent flavin oxidoreductase [unclassified Streptomyces]|uniref:NAD(P)H-dependent flavin oxidoreductase n=1 Tax=unclassified Streptomyces TaxID=2593676 RepID=UPI00225AFB4B|nr:MULTISPECIES: nitronate monooxygenase [unclassified Streptomyces]WSP53058.1 nitronate monooxygenase [Streptomyces sp. NBC_01241]MCX4791785.1 nitronate monooxygenase [Streptomyces sp. NBC_01221]MCX4799386.1 nitronate monooxygenase [Streptomyces sp. NBC_01242]WSJ40744.1 nitronate monooxygenase [Streptomyces sp. NBC_01321]WSP59793.1 nitronate monooxygenase [Streptomyces sp. NBC_01241]
MTSIPTPVTGLLGVRLPVIQAGMSWASSSSALPLAVTRAGGLGVVAAGPMRLDDLARVLDEMAAGTDDPWGVNLPLYRAGADDVIDLLLERRPPVLIASQGGPRRYLERFHDVGTVCLHVVAGVEHARKAADAGVDGLVVVGGEAGGHPPPAMVATQVLVRAVVSAVEGLPVVASGGVADGAGLAAMLALGAGAAQFGTRFLATEEATVHPEYKEVVLAAGVEDTRTVGHGLGLIRAVENDFTVRMQRLEESAAELGVRRKEFQSASLKDAALHGRVREGKVEAGQSAGLIDAVLPATAVVERIVAEYRTALTRLPLPVATEVRPLIVEGAGHGPAPASRA